MAAILYVHIPGLKLVEAEVPFAGGRLIQLPFEEWISLESEFEYTSTKYAESAPVFWISELNTNGDLAQEEMFRVASAAVWPVHTAFLLDSRAPLLPTPMLSCCYAAIPPPPEISSIVERAIVRLIGPLEREFIVYGSPLTYQYTTEELTWVESLYRFIEFNGIANLSDDVQAGIDVLEETARPDSWYGGDKTLCRLHGFVRCIAACESILLQPDTEGKNEITQSFGKHAAALLLPGEETQEQTAKHFADLYRFRSELMHGRSIPDQKDPAIKAKLQEGRYLLRNVVSNALLVRTSIPDGPPIWQQLKECVNDPGRQNILAKILKEGIHT